MPLSTPLAVAAVMPAELTVIVAVLPMTVTVTLRPRPLVVTVVLFTSAMVEPSIVRRSLAPSARPDTVKVMSLMFCPPSPGSMLAPLNSATPFRLAHGRG